MLKRTPDQVKSHKLRAKCQSARVQRPVSNVGPLAVSCQRPAAVLRPLHRSQGREELVRGSKTRPVPRHQRQGRGSVDGSTPSDSSRALRASWRYGSSRNAGCHRFFLSTQQDRAEAGQVKRAGGIGKCPAFPLHFPRRFMNSVLGGGLEGHAQRG